MEQTRLHKSFAGLLGSIQKQQKMACSRVLLDWYRGRCARWELSHQCSRRNPERSSKVPLMVANQRCVRMNRVTRLVDAVIMLHVRLLTRVLHFRLTVRESAVAKPAKNDRRSFLGEWPLVWCQVECVITSPRRNGHEVVIATAMTNLIFWLWFWYFSACQSGLYYM